MAYICQIKDINGQRCYEKPTKKLKLKDGRSIRTCPAHYEQVLNRALWHRFMGLQ